MNNMKQVDETIKTTAPETATESTRYLGETAFGTVEKVCAVCTVVNDQVADPKKIEKIYSYIQDMFGPEALDYEHVFSSSSLKTPKQASPVPPMLKKDIDPLW